MTELNKVENQNEFAKKEDLIQTMISFLRKIRPLIDVGTYIDGDNYCIRFYDDWRKKNVVSWVGITEEEFYQFRKMLQELGDEF